MAYPVFYPFKSRVLNATTASSGAITAIVPVPARAKFVGGYIGVASGSAGVIDCYLSVAGTTTGFTAIAGSTSIATTTTTNPATAAIPAPTTVTYLGAGDLLATTGTSFPAYTVSFVVQEF